MLEETNPKGDPDPPGGTGDSATTEDTEAYQQPSDSDLLLGQTEGDPDPPGNTGDPDPPGSTGGG